MLIYAAVTHQLAHNIRQKQGNTELGIYGHAWISVIAMLIHAAVTPACALARQKQGNN
jgi:hypothetical protein